MPVSTLGFSTSPVFGQHGAVSHSAYSHHLGPSSSSSSASGIVDSSLILNRASTSTSSSASDMSSSATTATLALQLRRHERKRQLMRYLEEEISEVKMEEYILLLM